MTTNKQFIIEDLKTGDFVDYEKTAILKEINKTMLYNIL